MTNLMSGIRGRPAWEANLIASGIGDISTAAITSPRARAPSDVVPMHDAVRPTVEALLAELEWLAPRKVAILRALLALDMSDAPSDKGGA